jgi:hypothetical protein
MISWFAERHVERMGLACEPVWSGRPSSSSKPSWHIDMFFHQHHMFFKPLP